MLLEFPILFQNESFIIVDKPMGWLSVAGRGDAHEGVPCLLHVVSQKLGRQVWPIHRLDQPVSGVILYALTAEAHRAANAWFETRKVKKRYEAITEGKDFPVAGTTFVWKSRLLRGKRRAYERTFGKLAVTEAQFLKAGKAQDLEFGNWSIVPVTGRSHQIRFHLSQKGFPIWGDVLYGSTPLSRNWTALSKEGIALRAVELDLSQTDAKSFGLPEIISCTDIYSKMRECEALQSSLL